MNTYEILFKGRLNHSIGETFPIIKTVTADSHEHALLSLYEDYEHITVLKSKEASNGDNAK